MMLWLLATVACSAGCVSQPAIGSVSLDYWRGKYVCYKREGEAQLLSKTETRPVPSAAATCASGYQACGAGTLDGDRTTCQPSAATCPLTGATAATATPSGYVASSALASTDTTSWYTRASYSGEVPINDIKLALWYPDGKRGDCFGTGADQTSYDLPGRSFNYDNDYPSVCSKRDERWAALDLRTEADVLSDHFDLHANCTGATNISDYVATGTACGAAPFSDTDCTV